jgi:hypothetical protein
MTLGDVRVGGSTGMDSILRIVPYGENLPGSVVTAAQVSTVLQRLEENLERHDLRWQDVSLLVLANSKLITTPIGDQDSAQWLYKAQQESDQNIKDGLDEFCARKNWHPSLIGTTVLSSFFASNEQFSTDISDGILFIAVASFVFDRIPVSFEITDNRRDRKYAGERVFKKAMKAFGDCMVRDVGTEISAKTIADTATGLLFTSGSGHTEAQTLIDFKECYAIGQDLLEAADKLNAEIVGGCSSNRAKGLSQCLYYSDHIGARTSYRYTYKHAAVMCLLPYTRAQLELDHPYKRVQGRDKLLIKFHPHEQYSDGRYFYIQEIDGRPPTEFLADYWGFTKDELRDMVRKRTAIPVEPQAHLVTIASSLNKFDSNIWPNVPIWLDEIDEKVMLRLVRAEAEDSNYYLMEMSPNNLGENARTLMTSVNSNFNDDVSMITFLCESRKYVLNSVGSNAEAEEIVSSAPSSGSIVGIYLNGEYSTGTRRSIGYHNYSQIGALFPNHAIDDLPRQVVINKQRSRLEFFACHARRDTPTVKQFMAYVTEHVPGATQWLDEDRLKTGDVLETAIRTAIGRNDQLFVAFISDRSVESSWVQRELSWAIEEEARQGRNLVLPVILDDRDPEVVQKLREAWSPKLVEYIEQRFCLKISDFDDDALRNKARRLADHVAGWVSTKDAPTIGPGKFMPGMIWPDSSDEEPDGAGEEN